MRIYMQDKRARKTIPAKGTRKYPIIYLGEGTVDNGKIEVVCDIPLYLNPGGCRFYAQDGERAEWVNNISQVDLIYEF